MHSFTHWFVHNAVPAFSRTLLHSLWQGLAAALLAAAIIRATRRSPAAWRYNALLAVYAALLLTALVTFFSSVAGTFTDADPAPFATAQLNAPQPIVGGVLVGAPADNQPAAWLLRFVDQNALALAEIWAFLFLGQLLRMALGLRFARQVKQSGTAAVDTEWCDWLQAAGRRMGIQKPVALLQSERLTVPVAIGFVKPVVLVPLGLMTGLSTRQVEAVLLHELAHIRRNDYLVNLVQSLADAIFFFNPAVRWISSRIREEREACCDAAAVQQAGDKRDYVEALVAFTRLSLPPAYAMALGGPKTHLLNRVKTIITRENSRLTMREQATLLAGTLALVAFGAFAFKPIDKKPEKQELRPAQAFVHAKEEPAFAHVTAVLKARPVRRHKPATDTVPTTKPVPPTKWKSLSTNTTDDGEGRTTQILATAEDGTTYRLRKNGDEIVLFTVNDRTIAKADYPQYAGVMDAIAQSQQERRELALKAREEANLVRQQQRELLAQKQALELQQRSDELAQRQQQRQVERSLTAEKRAEELRTKQALLSQTQSLQNEEMARIADERRLLGRERELALRKQKEYSRLQDRHAQEMRVYKAQAESLYNQQRHELSGNSNVSGIISDLAAAGLVEDENKLSFTLTNNELTVNGKAAANDLFEKLRSKYIHNKADSYRYSKKGNSTSTTINIE